MHVSVAIGMNQDAVLCTVCASHRSVNDVVVVPPCHLRDWLGADRTNTALLFPKVGQGSPSPQGLLHFDAEAFFQIAFPCRVVGVTVSFDFCVSGYRCCGGVAKPVFDGLSVFVLCCPEEVPVPIARSSKVTVGYPPSTFLRVSPSCPSPQGFKAGRVNMDKGFFCRSMLVKVRPSTSLGVEQGYQPVCCGLFVVLADLSDVCKKRFHVLFRRASKKLPVILPYMLSEKVTSVLNVRYPGLLFREFQPSFLEKVHDEGLDFRFQDLFRDTRHDEVIRVTYQIHLLILQ